MTGIGTIVNIIAVLAGSIIGMVFKRGISDKLSESLMKALGLATVFIGITGVLSDTVTVIDYEWSFAFPIPLSYLIYRILFFYIIKIINK